MPVATMVPFWSMAMLAAAPRLVVAVPWVTSEKNKIAVTPSGP